MLIAGGPTNGVPSDPFDEVGAALVAKEELRQMYAALRDEAWGAVPPVTFR